MNSNSPVNLLSEYTVHRRSYLDSPLYVFDPRYSHHYPLFGIHTISNMLRDSRIRFGLWLIKGPIFTYTKFFSAEEAEDPGINQAIIELEYQFSFKVEAKSQATQEFVLKTIKDYWENGVLTALRAIEWGFSPNQVMYAQNPKTGEITYQSLIPYSPAEAYPMSQKNRLTGLHLRRTNEKIRIPKAFIHVHQREINRYTGQSRLYGSHVPWHEQWNRGGARDVRKLWYFKNAYDSGTLYVPEGGTTDPITGEPVSNVDTGMQIMEMTQTGSYRVLPQAKGRGKGERDWEFEEPRSRPTPDGLREYLQDLRAEELEGIGIPPEVVESAGSNGLGSATGRKVPYMAFISSLAPIVVDNITDFKTQVINNLLKVNKLDPEYTITRIIPKIYSAELGNVVDPITGTDSNVELQN